MAVRGLCDEAGLSLMITVNSPSGLTWASQMDLPIYKISSWDYGFNDLWRMIGAEGSPIFIDTGPCYLHELAEGIDIIRRQDNDKIVLMHTFHTHNFSEMNMRTIPYLRDTFDCMVGYCAAGRDNYLDAVAVGVGACALEKRLSMDTGDNVLHSAVSLNPSEFMDYVKTMRGLKEAMGEYKLQPSGGDLIERRKWFRSVVADIGIMKGMNVNRDMLEAKRGENGISPKYIDFLIGRKATRDIERNETIELTDLG
jgi:sialic acid synthase SpsE